MADDIVDSASEHQIARIVLAAERDYLPASLAFLGAVAGRLGLGADDVAGLERAAGMICLNVIEHGFEAGQAASFDMVLLRRPGQLVVVVEDQGRPFDWTRLEAASSPDTSSLTRDADAVRFLNLGPQGNRVEIVKHLPFDHIETYIATGATTAPARSTEVSTAPVTVRSMTPADAIAVAPMPSTVTAFPTTTCTSPTACARCSRAGSSRCAWAPPPTGRS
jgi:anti-sigma regulatory factor (Ser/Thr protein kinase)